MTHWGWYWWVKTKHVRKTLCSQLPCLDSFTIYKGKSTQFTVTGDEHQTKFELAEAGLQVSNKDKSYFVPVEKQPCHFGGFRYFFRCPNTACGQRMRKLYYSKGYFLCRKCLKLGYYTQAVPPCRRYLRMKDKIEGVLKSAGGDTYHKPKWMRSRTFKAMRSRYFGYEHKHREALEREFKRIYGCSVAEALRTRLYKRKRRQS